VYAASTGHRHKKEQEAGNGTGLIMQHALSVQSLKQVYCTYIIGRHGCIPVQRNNTKGSNNASNKPAADEQAT